MKNFFKTFGPGILLAATGVGAGDLITAGMAGMNLGYTVLWACIFGALLKWALNEGLARYQFATDQTLLEGWVTHLGKWIRWVFLFYLIIWSYFVGGALINACGAAGANLIDFGLSGQQAKVVWGILHSLIGIALVLRGSFDLFEKVMSLLIGIMFLTVISSSLFLIDDIPGLFKGALVPNISMEGLPWILGVLGGVGGTLTILSYGYWIRQENRKGEEGLQLTRKDLAFSYFLTATFSMAMIVIGKHVGVMDGPKSLFPTYIAGAFGGLWGDWAKYIFLFGFWGGVFSSLLGVWQSVPYLFTDFVQLATNKEIPEFSKSKPYKLFLLSLALIPITTLWFKFEQIQILYAVMGAVFMPLLALTLLILNNSVKIVGKFKVHWFFNILYVLTLVFFSYVGIQKFFKG